MASRMRNGIVKRNKTYSYNVRVFDPATGKMKTKQVGGFKTERAAIEARDVARVAASRRELVAESAELLGDFLQRWLAAIDVKPKTLTGYRYHVEHYVAPRIGGMQLRSIKAPVLTGLFAELALTGGRAGGPLGRASIASVHRTLRSAFAWGVREQVISSNPVPAATLPPDPARHAPKKAGGPAAFDWEQLTRFLSVADGHDLGALFRLAAATGLRRGELCYLRWRHIDLEAMRVTIAGTRTVIAGETIETSPKSGHARTITIDDNTAAHLRRHRAAQEADRAQAGNLWCDEVDYVFTNAVGQAISPDRVSKAMTPLCKSAGVPRIKFHGLRHTHATLLLTAGAAVHEVSARLGHADATITMRIYAHALPSRADQLSDVFAGGLRSSDLASV